MIFEIVAPVMFLFFICLFIVASISMIRRINKATRESNKAYVSLFSCYDIVGNLERAVEKLNKKKG